MPHGSKRRRQRAADQLRAAPDWSDRRIAALVGCHHTTVAVVRRELAARGEISHLETASGRDGKRYPRRAAAPFPRDPEAPAEAVSVASPDALADSGARFGTVYADPPWPYDNRATRGAAEDHYRTMTLAEIPALPVARLAARSAHLHLWTTTAHLPDAFRVVEAWGFRYRSLFVWTKPQMGLGNYWRIATEHLLLGVRGGCPFRCHGLMNHLCARRGRHSEKPEAVRRLVQRVSPGPRLELFGRKLAPRRTLFGDQAGAERRAA